MMQKKQYEKNLIGLGVLLSILYAFFVNHVDCNTITTWGYDLLESLRLHDASNFPVYTYETHSMPCNYNLFVNILTAVWLSPVYLLQTVLGANWNLVIFDTWYKVFVLGIHFANIGLFYRILGNMHWEERRKKLAVGLYMMSAVVLVAVVGKGQVDNLSLFFLLCGVLFLQQEKYTKMSLLLGLSLCTKPFTVLAIVPMYLLLLEKRHWKVVKDGIILAIPYAIDAVITRIWMPRYSEMVALTSEMFKDAFGTSRIEGIFQTRLNQTLLFFAVALILCFICMQKGIHHRVKPKDYLLYPTLLYMAYGIFVSATCYWFVVIIPALIVMGLELQDISEFLLLYFGSNLGVVVKTYFQEAPFQPGGNYTLWKFLKSNSFATEELTVSGVIKERLYLLGTTFFVICTLMICIIYAREKNGWFMEEQTEEQRSVSMAEDRTYKFFCKLLQGLPVILYFAVILWKTY
jgi:hypothetical protein